MCSRAQIKLSNNSVEGVSRGLPDINECAVCTWASRLQHLVQHVSHYLSLPLCSKTAKHHSFVIIYSFTPASGKAFFFFFFPHRRHFDLSQQEIKQSFMSRVR